jgi:hypothetical protein
MAGPTASDSAVSSAAVSVTDSMITIFAAILIMDFTVSVAAAFVAGVSTGAMVEDIEAASPYQPSSGHNPFGPACEGVLAKHPSSAALPRANARDDRFGSLLDRLSPW